MKVFIFLILCAFYSASCFVITIPLEDMENIQNNKNSLDTFGPIDYRQNSPDNDVEVFSPSEVNYQQPTFIGNDMITPDLKRTFTDSESIGTGSMFNDWTILTPDIPEEPPLEFPHSTDNVRTYNSKFDRPAILNMPSIYGTFPREYDAPSNENDDDIFSETVLVNGMPTELSQERTDELDKLYQTAYAYQWLMRFCMTHPRCNTETLLELIMSTPENINQNHKPGFLNRY